MGKLREMLSASGPVDEIGNSIGKCFTSRAVVAYAFNPNTVETDIESLSSRLDKATYRNLISKIK